MRQTYLEFCDLKARNFSGEVIPPFACMQVCGYSANAQGASEFLVKKPDGKGKLFIINSPFAIPIIGADNQPGVGDATNHVGAFVLFSGDDPSLSTDEALLEWGPKPGTWTIDKDGKGFVIVGSTAGEAGSPPGFPPVASTKRVRVAIITTAAKPVNRIQGTVAMTVSPTTLAVPVVDIFVLSGVDPRPEPHTPLQAIIVQNNLKKSYTNGVDRITATQNEADLKWYVETTPGEGSEVVHFEIIDNKVYGSNYARAMRVTPAGEIDAASPPFYVVDPQNQFFGRKAEDNKGYRGHAVRYVEGYQEGLPGYRIISMEGPAQWLIVTLNEAAGSVTKCLVDAQNQIWGRPFRGRRLPPAGFVDVYNPLGTATGAKQGDRWLVALAENKEQYIFILPIQAAVAGVPAIAMITLPCPAMANGNAIGGVGGAEKSATPGVSSPDAATIMKWTKQLPAKLVVDDRYQPMAVLNLTQTELNASEAKPILKAGDIQEFKDPDAPEDSDAVLMFVPHGPRDIRQLGGFDRSKPQQPYHDPDSDNEILGSEDCPPGA